MKLLSCLFVCLFLVTTSYAQEKTGGQGGKPPSSPSTESPSSSKSGGPGAGDPNPNFNIPSGGFVFPENTNSGSVSRPNGASAGQASGAGTNSSRSAVVQGNFRDCPFTINPNEFIPEEIITNINDLAKSLNNSSTGNCKNIGTEFTNLIELTTSGGCTSNPPKCDTVFTTLINQANQNQACLTQAPKLLDTIIGAALKFGGVAGKLALGVSAIKGLIQLVNKRKTNAVNKAQNFLNDKLLKEQMEAVNACYANQLYQDIHCRDTYTKCMLYGTAADCPIDLKNARVSEPKNSSVNQTPNKITNTPAPAPASTKKNCDKFRNDEDSLGNSTKESLKMCLFEIDPINPEDHGKKNVMDIDNDHFKIETNVMSDIYACVAYWNMNKKPEDKTAFTAIRDNCFKNKKTKGGASINEYTLHFNKILDFENAYTVNLIDKDFLPSVLEEAQNYLEKKIKKGNIDTAAELQVAVNTCYYGYGTSLALKTKKNGLYYAKGKKSIPEQCSSMNTCISEIFSEKTIVDTEDQVLEKKLPQNYKELPENDDDWHDKIVPNQSLEAMFLDRRKSDQEDKFQSNPKQLCFGMAMNQFTNHQNIAMILYDKEFHKNKCSPDRAPKTQWSDSTEQ